MNIGPTDLLVYVVLPLLALAVLYWVIRLAVRHANRDSRPVAH